VLVYDHGWSCVDVTVLSVTQGLITVDASRSDRSIGSKEIVSALVELCAKEVQRKTRLRRPRKQAIRAAALPQLRRLLKSLEQDAVRILPSSAQTTTDIDSLYKGCDFLCTVSRARFEDACSPVRRQILNLLTAALEDANVDAEDISCVLLADGLSKIPTVQNRVKARLPTQSWRRLR
jgi:L1 cell adhesion molecule like protein